MKAYLDLLKNTDIFTGFSDKEIETLIKNMDATKTSFPKGSFIYHEGECRVKAAIVLAGSIYIIKEDFWGNRTILSEISRGEMFAETYNCMANEALGVSVVAAQDCSCLFMDFRTLMKSQENADEADAYRQKLLMNLIVILAGKNLFLTKKIEHVSKRSTRQKLLSYLSEIEKKAGNSRFKIPFNRQELADYLSVDRSAMSTELSKLQKEGILEYRKNSFFLKNLK